MTTARLYRRTQSGQAAWQRQDQRVPVEYRRVLGLINADTHPDNIRARLGRYSDAETLELLDELVQSGLLESVEAAAEHDLDFTGSFSFADLVRKTPS